MFPKVWFINLIMAGLIVLFGARTYGVWSQTDKTAVKFVEARKPAKQTGDTIGKRGIIPESGYENVARNNLFNPERVEPRPEKSEPGPEVKKLTASAKTIALHGVILLGDYKTALVGKLEPKPGEKQTQWVKVGDAVAGFNVIEIKPESIIVSEGADQYELFLYDKDRPKKAAAMTKREIKPTIVSAEPPVKSSTDLSAGKADDSNSEQSTDTSETKYQHVKQPSEELRRKIISQYRDLPPPPPPQLNEPTGKGDWDIPLQQYQKGSSKSADSKTDAVKTKPKAGRDWE
jgi:hypothetical protein